MNYFFDIWSALSQLLNTLLGGVPCETVSGRAYRANGWAKKVINKVFFLQDNHCLEAHLSDVFDATEFLSNSEEVVIPFLEQIEDKVKSPEWFKEQTFEDKLLFAKNGVWINKGIREFFDLRFDESLPDEDRREIAKVYAFRYGMPYNDPTVKNRVPTGLGMGEDGNQQ